MPLKTVYIVSLPRSGSTVLTTLLGQFEDVLCPPETFFLAVLELLTHEEMADHRTVAALFLASCSDGSPLTLEEAEGCIQLDKAKTLNSLALAIAVKYGRDPDTLHTVVWKSTRMIGCWRFATSLNAKLIILRRNPLNVFQSQHRVHFGKKNQNPVRFAFFASSYEVAFQSYPRFALLSLDYKDIPLRLPEVVEWVGSSGVKLSVSHQPLDMIARNNTWHENIDKPFTNEDAEKLKTLTPFQRTAFIWANAIFTRLTYLSIIARKLADHRQMTALRVKAVSINHSDKNPKT